MPSFHIRITGDPDEAERAFAAVGIVTVGASAHFGEGGTADTAGVKAITCVVEADDADSASQRVTKALPHTGFTIDSVVEQ